MNNGNNNNGGNEVVDLTNELDDEENEDEEEEEEENASDDDDDDDEVEEADNNLDGEEDGGEDEEEGAVDNGSNNDRREYGFRRRIRGHSSDLGGEPITEEDVIGMRDAILRSNGSIYAAKVRFMDFESFSRQFIHVLSYRPLYKYLQEVNIFASRDFDLGPTDQYEDLNPLRMLPYDISPNDCKRLIECLGMLPNLRRLSICIDCFLYDDDIEGGGGEGGYEKDQEEVEEELLFPNLEDLEVHNVGSAESWDIGPFCARNMVRVLQRNNVKLRFLTMEHPSDSPGVSFFGIDELVLVNNIATALDILADCISACNTTLQEVRFKINREDHRQLWGFFHFPDDDHDVADLEYYRKLNNKAFLHLVEALRDNDTIQYLKIASDGWEEGGVLHLISNKSIKKMIEMLKSNGSLIKMIFRVVREPPDPHHDYDSDEDYDAELEKCVKNRTKWNRFNHLGFLKEPPGETSDWIDLITKPMTTKYSVDPPVVNDLNFLYLTIRAFPSVLDIERDRGESKKAASPSAAAAPSKSFGEDELGLPVQKKQRHS